MNYTFDVVHQGLTNSIMSVSQSLRLSEKLKHNAVDVMSNH
jgi:hypothetical protein